jgi:hypothetical protein
MEVGYLDRYRLFKSSITLRIGHWIRDKTAIWGVFVDDITTDGSGFKQGKTIIFL